MENNFANYLTTVAPYEHHQHSGGINMSSQMEHSDDTNINDSGISPLLQAPEGYSVPHIILTSLLVTVIMFVIVLGNLLVVVAICTDKTLKTTQNWFIASLAVADCLLGLVIMPFSLANEMMGYWYFGHLWCDLWKAIDVLLSTASILSICLISLDRYWSITRAIEYSRQRTPTRAALMIATVWLLSAVICVPPLIGWKNPLPLSDYPLCLLSGDIGYVLYSTMGSFYIPCVIMVFVYFKIFIAARNLARKNIIKKAKMKKLDRDFNTELPDSGLGHSANCACETCSKAVKDTCSIDSIESKTHVNKPKKIKLRMATEQSNLLTGDSDTDSMKMCKIELMGDKENDLCSTTHETDNCNNAKVNTPLSSKHVDGNAIQVEFKVNNACLQDDETEQQHQHYQQHQTQQEQQQEQQQRDEGGQQPHADTVVELNKQESPYASKCNSLSGRSLNMRKIGESISRKHNKRHTSNKVNKGWRTASLREHERHKRKVAKARERRATFVLGLVMAAFILCWFPFFTLYIITSFCECIGDIVFAVVFWAGYCNSALNPIIYTVFNRDFRHAFHRIICGNMRRRR